MHGEPVDLEVAPHQSLDRCEMPLQQILESASAVGQGFVGGRKWRDDRKKMAVVIHVFLNL